MKNKIIFSLLCLALIKSSKVFSQENRNVRLIGYTSMNEYLYFDSLNSVMSDELRPLNHTYDFYIVFKIDTTSTIKDFEIIKIPGAELPKVVESYFKRMIMTTNGKWLPQFNNNKKVTSDQIIYQCSLVKKDQSIEDRIKDTEAVIKYFFESQKLDEKITKIVSSEKKKYITLNY